MQENLTQKLKKVNKLRIINLKNINQLQKFSITSINLQNIIAESESTSYIDINKIEQYMFILNFKNTFFGPFLWYDNFENKTVSENILKIENNSKKIFILKLLKSKLKLKKIKYIYKNNNLIITYINNNNIEVIEKELDNKTFNYFLKTKIKINKILNIDNCNTEIFENIANNLFNIFFSEQILSYNTLYILELDKNLSILPLEIINYYLLKFNSIAIFDYSFIKQTKNIFKNSNNKPENISLIENDIKNKIKNTTSNKIITENPYFPAIYIYSVPYTTLLKNEQSIILNLEDINIENINNKKSFLGILEKYKTIIFSGHGYLKNNINTIIINKKPLNIFKEKIKNIPTFFYFSSCLITSGYFDNNLLITLFKNGLKEALTTQFLIEDKIAFYFFKDFMLNFDIFNFPLINYIYSTFKNYNNFSFINKFIIVNNDLENYSNFISYS